MTKLSFQNGLDLDHSRPHRFYVETPHKIPHKCVINNCFPAGLQSTVRSANEVITYLRYLPKYNNTSISYEVILKTGFPLAGDSSSGDRQGTTLEPAKKQHCKMDVSEYIIFTDIMKAVLAFAWIMYLWEAYIARRQVNGAAFSSHTEYFVILDKMMTPH